MEIVDDGLVDKCLSSKRSEVQLLPVPISVVWALSCLKLYEVSVSHWPVHHNEGGILQGHSMCILL